MSFILEIGFTSHQRYIAEYLETFFQSQQVEANVSRIGTTVIVEADEKESGLEPALQRLNEEMPYSLFMTSVSHRFSETAFQKFEPVPSQPLPLNLGLCHRCKAEMLDPSSRRYYYPFTGCRHCGGQYAFFEHYPYERANTAWRFVQPCPECAAEFESNPFRRDYALISCHSCSVALEMVNGGKSRYANDAAGCKQLFEMAAKAIVDGKSVVMKTTFGYRRFYRAAEANITEASILLHINSRTMMQDLSLTKQEIESLFSMEKPLLKVAVQCEKCKVLFGDVTRCKVPDEAFTVLLCEELAALQLDYIAYEVCDETAEGDYRVGFDLPLNVQSEMELFIGGDTRCVKQGERVSFPAEIATPVDTLSVTDGLVAVNSGRNHLIDRMEHFEGASAGKMNLLEGSRCEIEHSNTHAFSASHGALMSTLASYKFTGSAVGVFFEGETIEFIYFNGSHVTTVVPSVAFEPERLKEKLETLREGSERLMANLEAKRPELYAVLETVEAERYSLFETVASVIGVSKQGFEGVDDAALKFMGKGGTQIDMTLGDNRFNPYALIGSLVSYKMADVEPVMLSYSLFESLGDYFVDILTQLQTKSKAERVVVCGANIAQSSLYSRIVQKMKAQPPLLNRSFPIGADGVVVGGIYI